MKHIMCQTHGCGHAWNVHAPTTNVCRVTGCSCRQYAEVAPVREELAQSRSEVLAEAASRLEAGQIVILAPGTPDRLDACALAVVRGLLGQPRAEDPSLAFVMVELPK